jgi:hypothetical protein
MSGTIGCNFPGCDWHLYVAGDSRDGARALLRHRLSSHPLEPTAAEHAHQAIEAEVHRQAYGKQDILGTRELPVVPKLTDVHGRPIDTGDDLDPERPDDLRAD